MKNNRSFVAPYVVKFFRHLFYKNNFFRTSRLKIVENYNQTKSKPQFKKNKIKNIVVQIGVI